MEQAIRDAIELVLVSTNTVEGPDQVEFTQGLRLINCAYARRMRVDRDAQKTADDDYDPGDPPQDELA